MTIDRPSPDLRPALRALWQEAFGDADAFLDSFEKYAFSEERCRCALIDGELAASLYWFDCSVRGERVAYLYAIATARAYRSQGVCSALMDDTHRHLSALGYSGAVLVPGERWLFDFYARRGYAVCGYIGEIHEVAAEVGVGLRSLDADGYAKLRRVFLPEGGVIQENENLGFLCAQAQLLTGDGFLLAARREGDSLVGLELLGDTASAPKILRTLGLERGVFRIPTGDEPFAMYRALGNSDTPAPTYFGLAFD